MDLSNFIVKLEFNLDMFSPMEYQQKWKILKKNIEFMEISLEDRNNLLLEVKNYCILEINKNLPLLKRVEGGLGGDLNINDKQLRFLLNHNKYKFPNENNTIIINMFNSDNNDDKWTLDELSDLINAFVETFNNYMDEDCCRGKITLINK